VDLEMKIIAFLAGIASAACWLISGSINVHDASGSYWSQPVVNPVVLKRRRWATIFNAAAAFLSAVAILAQACS
jgi:hypothetical protein